MEAEFTSLVSASWSNATTYLSYVAPYIGLVFGIGVLGMLVSALWPRG